MNQKVTIVSEKQPQKGQNERSSNNFTTADFSRKISIAVRFIRKSGYKVRNRLQFPAPVQISKSVPLYRFLA